MERLIDRGRDMSRQSLTARLRADSIRHGIGEIRFLPTENGTMPNGETSPKVFIRIRSVHKIFARLSLDGLAAELLIQLSPARSCLVKGTLSYLHSEKGSVHFYQFIPEMQTALRHVRYLGAERRSNVLQLGLRPPGQEFRLENRLAPLESPETPKRPLQRLRRRHRVRLPSSS